MQSKMAAHACPRCDARTRNGGPCRSPAMQNGRCWMHSGKSPGAPKGNSNALKHGRYTAQTGKWRHRIAELRRSIADVIEGINTS
ncbi:MAG: HGGxSTG domain-containing protein [Hyphomicrobiales bacterium]